MNEAEKEAAPLPVRSNAGLAAVHEWISYLKATSNYESYDAMCDCHRCNRIRANYENWKAPNADYTPSDA
jgi:hypothetical protein